MNVNNVILITYIYIINRKAGGPKVVGGLRNVPSHCAMFSCFHDASLQTRACLRLAHLVS